MIMMIPGCVDKKPDIVPETTVNETPAPAITPVFTVPAPSTVYIDIKGSTFNPLEINIVNGTTVQWKNLDSSVYEINGSGFLSPPLNKYSTWNHTFNTTGIFKYNCSSHPSMPTGRIVVE